MTLIEKIQQLIVGEFKFIKVFFSNQNKNVNKSGTKMKSLKEIPKLLSFKCGVECCNLDLYCS